MAFLNLTMIRRERCSLFRSVLRKKRRRNNNIRLTPTLREIHFYVGLIQRESSVVNFLDKLTIFSFWRVFSFVWEMSEISLSVSGRRIM